MLRAGSLFYALAITVIMALVSASLLLAAHYGRLRLQRDQIQEDLILNSKSGLELLMDEQFPDEYGSTKDIDLFEQGRDSVSLTTRAWGAFEIAISRAHKHSLSHQIIASIGWQADPDDHTALILADMDRPLSITGNTKITGDCYLPAAGIQRGYIEGQNYIGDKMVYGETKKSDRFLPKYNDTLVKRLENLVEYRVAQTDSVIYNNAFQQNDSISNSFSNQPLYIFSEGAIIINAQTISGQVCIISHQFIRLEKNCSVHNALLIAPYIEIDDEVKGDFQAFARDSLSVGKNVRLSYPTVLGIIATEKSPDFTSMIIGENSKIFGQLFACSTADDFRKHVVITTSKTSVIYGEIYSADLIDHKGSVLGDIICSKFELSTSSSEYENYLMDAVINRLERSSAYVSSALTRKQSDHKAVVQWLE